jgi:hypothetical protein
MFNFTPAGTLYAYALRRGPGCYFVEVFNVEIDAST